MKKLFFAAAFAVFGMASAQMEQGTWVVGATSNLGLNTAKTSVTYPGLTDESATVNTFTFNPSFGYFVIDKLAVGIDLGLTNVTVEEDNAKSTQKAFSVMPSATYYFENESKVVPYLGAGIGYSSMTSGYNWNGISQSETFDGLAWKAKGGIVYLLNRNIGLDLGLSYNQLTSKEQVLGNDLVSKMGTFGVNVGFSLFLGKSKNPLYKDSAH